MDHLTVHPRQETADNTLASRKNGQGRASTGDTERYKKAQAQDTMIDRNASSGHPPPSPRLTQADEPGPGEFDPSWPPQDHLQDERARRSRRRSVVVATCTALFFTLMLVIGTPWSLLLSLGGVLAVGHWDRRLRADPPDIPVLWYFAGIIFGGIIILAICGVLLLLADLVLP